MENEICPLAIRLTKKKNHVSNVGHNIEKGRVSSLPTEENIAGFLFPVFLQKFFEARRNKLYGKCPVSFQFYEKNFANEVVYVEYLSC